MSEAAVDQHSGGDSEIRGSFYARERPCRFKTTIAHWSNFSLLLSITMTSREGDYDAVKKDIAAVMDQEDYDDGSAGESRLPEHAAACHFGVQWPPFRKKKIITEL